MVIPAADPKPLNNSDEDIRGSTDYIEIPADPVETTRPPATDFTDDGAFVLEAPGDFGEIQPDTMTRSRPSGRDHYLNLSGQGFDDEPMAEIKPEYDPMAPPTVVTSDSYTSDQPVFVIESTAIATPNEQEQEDRIFNAIEAGPPPR